MMSKAQIEELRDQIDEDLEQGMLEDEEFINCENCNGSGIYKPPGAAIIPSYDEPDDVRWPCPYCDGEGVVEDE